MQDEILDIVDEDDNVVGSDTRENIWKRGLEHNVRAVNIFIFKPDGKLLVPKRSMKKRIYPGCYDFSCGEQVLSGEPYENAAARGLSEEIGIRDIALENLGKLTPKDGIRCFAMNYKAIIDKEIDNFSKQEVESLHWFTLDEVKNLLNTKAELFKGDFKETFEKYFG
jgi:isopentenyldiphosphate isomerase